MTNVDLPPTSRDDDVIIDISSSTTEEIDREQLKLKFRLALIDDVDNKKTSEIKAKSDPDIPSSIIDDRLDGDEPVRCIELFVVVVIIF
ncbi:unnamed protein product [Rotaria sordida]|uniref:Uncharacterized protein n=1 Tax=Rotaria sordida TaxID=392033 RepID=A0A819Q7N0_9BILA|nr:unnamed protein product [Rotaria sordida]CAF4024871.1 unnamed protein product [Rotaria sordida]